MIYTADKRIDIYIYGHRIYNYNLHNFNFYHYNSTSKQKSKYLIGKKNKNTIFALSFCIHTLNL